MKLGEICSFQSGGTPSKNDEEFFNGSIPWITTVALNGKHINATNAIDWISEKAIQKSAAKIVPSNSIMIGTRVGVGKVAINDVEMSTNQDIISLIGIDESRWNKDFLCKFIQSKNHFLIGQARGATIKGIKMDLLSSLEIPTFSIEKQSLISNVLNHIMKIIDSRRRELQALDDLIKARFVEMFGDIKTNSKNLKCVKGYELFKFSSGRFLPEQKRLTEGIPVYGGNGIAWYTDEPLIDYPTIIIGRVGAQCGNVHLIKEPVWITDNAIYIKECKTNLLTWEFLSEMMTVMDFSQYADFSGQPKITQKPLETQNYLIPDREAQNRFSMFCKQINKSKSAVQKALDQAQLLFDSLMQKYFG